MEQVSWIESSRALRQLGLKHPTEAQWEFAARAGGDSPVAGGLSGAQLADYANLSDEWARVHNAGFSSFESWNDGFTSHARVGSLAPNGLGFHDMQGNVWEFCSDASENYTQEMQRDPEMPGTASSLRIIRGGSFVNLAHQARVSLRDNVTPELRSATTGVRPARRVLP
jgi:formylglycine-generating enzyme required for sulfatase activity